MAPVKPKTLEVFAYDTVKLVRILDRRLGFLGTKMSYTGVKQY